MPNNRVFGHNVERKYANIFKELFKACKTTRESSKLLDSCKVDLDNIPFNIQIKGGKQSSLNSVKVLTEMTKLLEEHFPERLNLPKAVLHEARGHRGKKRVSTDSLITMTFDDFFKLITKIYGENKREV